MSFEQINYKGKSLERNLGAIVDDGTDVMYYKHIYRSTYGAVGKGRHMCMQWGYWCWQQAREYPLDAIKYLVGRLKK